jgi:DNA-binding XRE family transcriptional regulator
MVLTHFYAITPGHCRYLGASLDPNADPTPYSGQLHEGEQLHVVPNQPQDAAYQLALAAARGLITPELMQWSKGAKIKEMRTAAGMRHVDVAAATGLTPKQLSALENGHISNPEYATLKRLALVLGVDMCDLV